MKPMTLAERTRLGKLSPGQRDAVARAALEEYRNDLVALRKMLRERLGDLFPVGCHVFYTIGPGPTHSGIVQFISWDNPGCLCLESPEGAERLLTISVDALVREPDGKVPR